MRICKIALPDSLLTTVLLVKIPDFGHFISLGGMNSVFTFNKYFKKIFFSLFAAGFCPKNLAFARKIFAAGFCPKNLAFARKIMALSESGRGGCSPQTPWLVRLWLDLQVRRDSSMSHLNVSVTPFDSWLRSGSQLTGFRELNPLQIFYVPPPRTFYIFRLQGLD